MGMGRNEYIPYNAKTQTHSKKVHFHMIDYAFCTNERINQT